MSSSPPTIQNMSNPRKASRDSRRREVGWLGSPCAAGAELGGAAALLLVVIAVIVRQKPSGFQSPSHERQDSGSNERFSLFFSRAPVPGAPIHDPVFAETRGHAHRLQGPPAVRSGPAGVHL